MSFASIEEHAAALVEDIRNVDMPMLKKKVEAYALLAILMHKLNDLFDLFRQGKWDAR